MTDESEHGQVLEDHGQLPWRYDLHVLDSLIDLYVERKWGSILVTAFDIFQQVSFCISFIYESQLIIKNTQDFFLSHILFYHFYFP